MFLKPASCHGCPYATRSRFYVPDEIVERAPVMVVGQNPGAEEERVGKPFVGKTGQMQEADFFPLAGLARGAVSIGNAIRCRLDDSNELPELDKPELRQAIEHCTRAHLKLPSGVRLLVAQGKHALYALTGEGRGAEDTGEDEEKGNSARTITGWRGWVLPYQPSNGGPQWKPEKVWTPGFESDLPVLAVNHLAALFRNPKMRLSMLRDWAKVPLILGGQWPEPMPPILTERVWPLDGPWAFDTEFVPETNYLIRYSFAKRSGSQAAVYVIEGTQSRSTEGRVRLILHNADADLDHWESLTGLSWDQYDLDDTMHADAVLWGGQPHGLNYLGSLYARTNRWKHLVKTNPVQYSGGDALGTWDVWQALQPQLQRDPGSLQVYQTQQLPLVHVIRRAGAPGLKLNQQKVEQALVDLEAKGRDATVLAQAAAGFPLNLGSNPQVAQQLYLREGIKVQRRARK